MSLEKVLTDELRTVGSGVATPPTPDVAALVRRAEKVRVRNRMRASSEGFSSMSGQAE